MGNSILFTNLFLSSRSGSELHTLELAKKFKDEGWTVSCYALVVSYPLQKYFEDSGIALIEYGSEQKLSSHYNVLFAQHHIVSDYLWNATRATFDMVVVSILGAAGGHESLPEFLPCADLAVFVSEKAREAHAGELSRHSIPSMVFPNYATSEFFSSRQPKAAHQPFPKKIAIISNHIPKELYELQKIGEDERGITVEMFGLETTAVEITPAFLKRFDLVISIGRTAQYCFAVGVPYYCYDHFGGPGFIKPDTVDKHASWQFSGRTHPVRMTAEEILSDICENYLQAIDHLPRLYEWATNNASFDSQFNLLVGEFEKYGKGGSASRKDQLHNAESSIVKSKMLCDYFVADCMHMIGVARVFFSQNERGSADENNSVTFKYHYGNTVEFELTPGSAMRGMKAIRFDPDMHPCHCSCTSSGLLPQNAQHENGETYSFYHNDPIFIIDRNLQLSKIVFSAQPVSESELIAFGTELAKELKEAKHDLEETKCALEAERSVLEQIKSIRWTCSNLKSLILAKCRKTTGD